jgi:hypothetical protein
MADNFTIGSVTYASKDIAGIQFQKCIFTNDAGVAMPGDAANGLDVDVTRLPALPAGTNNIGDVDVVSLPALPAGGNVIGGVTQSGTWNVGTVTTVTTVAAVTAITNALPVGANTIGNVNAIQSGTWNVGDGGGSLTVDGSVSVSGLVPGTTATSLGKAEDAPAADGDTGVMLLAVRKDVAATTVGTNGDYHPLEVDANGRLWCSTLIDSALPTGGNVIGGVTQSGTWNVGTVTTVTTVAAVTAITNALPAGTNAIGKLAANSGVDIGDVDVTSITPPTLTLGTQGATGFSVQELKDAGRTHVHYYAVAAAAGTTTTETAITLTKASGTGATSSAASFVITNGKRFRITSITFATRGHATATIQSTTFSLRINTAGAVTTSSTPIVLSARCATPAVASEWDRFIVPIPDGFEIVGNGTIQFGVTAAATYTTNAPTWDVLITGFEY